MDVITETAPPSENTDSNELTPLDEQVRALTNSPAIPSSTQDANGAQAYKSGQHWCRVPLVSTQLLHKQTVTGNP